MGNMHTKSQAKISCEKGLKITLIADKFTERAVKKLKTIQRKKTKRMWKNLRWQEGDIRNVKTIWGAK